MRFSRILGWAAFALAGGLLDGTVAAAHAQGVIAEMTPALIQQAIVEGSTDKRIRGTYDLRSLAYCGGVVYSTPYSRVVQAAKAAKTRYKTFTESDVTPGMIAPEIEVLAEPRKFSDGTIINVETIVVTPKKTKDISKATHPTTAVPFDETYQNLFGAKFEGKGLVARFPIALLTEENTIRVVRPGGRECEYDFSLKKVR